MLDGLFLFTTTLAAVLLLGGIGFATGISHLGTDPHRYRLDQALFIAGEQAIVFLYPIAYRIWGWRSRATIGMRLLGLRVADARSHQRLTYPQCALRLCGLWFSWATLGLGFLWTLSAKKRSWADLYSDTVVLRTLPWPQFYPGSPAPAPPPEPRPAPLAPVAWRWIDVVPVLIILVPFILGVDRLVIWIAHTFLTGLPTAVLRPVTGLLADFLYYGTMVAIVLFLSRRRHATVASLGLRFPGWRWVGAALPFASLALVLESMGAIVSFGLFPGTPNNQCQDIRYEFGGSFILALISVALIAPFAEELIFRGFIFGWLAKHLSVVRAVTASAILFSAAHILFQQPTLFLPIFTTGLVLATLYSYARSIWPTFVVHLSFNLLATLVLFASPGC